MTIAILTLILLSYMKITGKTLPAVEKRLNKVKNAKKKNPVVDLANVAEKEVLSTELTKVDKVAFKHQKHLNVYPKIYSGSLKI